MILKFKPLKRLKANHIGVDILGDAVKAISDFGITIADRGGLVCLTFLTALTAMYWKGDEEKYKFFNYVSEERLLFLVHYLY